MSRAETVVPDRRVAFVDLALRVADGQAPAAALRTALRALERRHGVRLRPAWDGRPTMTDPDAWIADHLHPFLDDTHLTIAGGEFCNDIDVCDAAGAQLGATWRAWGGILADWANRRGWPRSPAPRRWTYLDFYMDGYAGTQWPAYRGFVRAVRAAVGVAAP
jgi:hypothetical protein